MPLLLSIASPPLAVLVPNPVPPSAPPEVAAAAKYPFSSLRKSLRLLIEDNEIEELENDISYVYSGWAPISVRLVQCVAQKGGVLSNPAEREKKSGEDADGKKTREGGMGRVQAHPIVGWKGFEDVVASIPGDTVDIVQSLAGVEGGVSASISSLSKCCVIDALSWGAETWSAVLPREQSTTTVVFFLGGCTYTEIAALRWVGRQNKGRKFLIATTGIMSGKSMVESIAGTGAATGLSKEAGL